MLKRLEWPPKGRLILGYVRQMNAKRFYITIGIAFIAMVSGSCSHKTEHAEACITVDELVAMLWLQLPTETPFDSDASTRKSYLDAYSFAWMEYMLVFELPEEGHFSTTVIDWFDNPSEAITEGRKDGTLATFELKRMILKLDYETRPILLKALKEKIRSALIKNHYWQERQRNFKQTQEHVPSD